MSTDHFRLRTATTDDLEQIVDVCSTALGWTSGHFDRELFEWKHLHNPFGPSLMLVAEDESGIAAVRPLMKWQFRSGSGEQIRAARAVDTATHPRAQGQGLFTRLTRLALEEADASDGVHRADFIFNTPNKASLAGYLKMGWVERGRIGFGLSVRSPISAGKLVRSRTRADKPSLATPHIGISVDEGLSLLDPANPCPQYRNSGLLTTDHSIDSLRWRYAEAPIDYRFLPGPDSSGIIVRLRQRGAVRELLVAHRCGPIDDAAAGRAVRIAMRNTHADVCVGWDGLGGTLTNERPGPTLALRTFSTPSARPPGTQDPQFAWMPGDVELF